LRTRSATRGVWAGNGVAAALHGGRSLTLRDGNGCRVLATCWGAMPHITTARVAARRNLSRRALEHVRARPTCKFQVFATMRKPLAIRREDIPARAHASKYKD
jgi:hypothetical protein